MLSQGLPINKLCLVWYLCISVWTRKFKDAIQIVTPIYVLICFKPLYFRHVLLVWAAFHLMHWDRKYFL